MPSARSILLPILGAISAIAAFGLAAPYEATLDRPGIGLDDPRALYTFGTEWGAVNRLAFGALICGLFCIALTLGRRSPARVFIAGGIGALLGAGVNYLTDSSADVIGMALGPVGSLVAILAWCILVPAGIAFTIAFSTGITNQNLRRALYATKIAAFASLAVQIGGSVIASVDGAGTSLRNQVPVWRMTEIAVGIALGLTIALADRVVQLGSIRLIHGRNEFKDWNLDYPVNRLGSGEENEIPLRGLRGVERLHALLVFQNPYFFLDPKAPTLVNGQPVTAPLALNSGDQIAVGEARLVFYARSGAARVAPPAPPAAPAPIPVPAQTTRLLIANNGQEVRLAPGRYGVGRDEHNAFRLAQDSRISRHHAEFIVTDSGLTLNDLGSTNGTILNGNRIHGQADLHPGDVVQFGSTLFTYRG